MKLGKSDESEGPPRKAVVKGWSMSISGGPPDGDASGEVAAVVGLGVLSLLL